MKKVPLNNDSEFLVQEEKVLVYILAFLFFALFLYGLIDAMMKGFQNVNYQSFIFMIALIPAILLFAKGKKNRIYIRINKTGIYHYERLVTNWPHFIDAYIAQKKTTISIQDNFMLVIEYYKSGSTDGFRRKIPLTNTQNKSEEEVVEAVKFYYRAYKNSGKPNTI